MAKAKKKTTSKKAAAKPRIGVIGVTGCAGCVLEVGFQEALLDLAGMFDIVSYPMVKGRNPEGPFDILFVEGTICHKEDLELIQKWREQAKILVALGDCAAHAGIPGMKNFRDDAEVEEYVYKKATPFKGHPKLENLPPRPLHHYVKVDFTVKGCPADKDQIVYFIKDVLQGKNHGAYYDKPVCKACREKENRCLMLHDGKICMGPSVDGGCNALCPSFGHECYGCRGPVKDANIKAHKELLHDMGFDKHRIDRRFQIFASLEVDEIEKKNEEGEE